MLYCQMCSCNREYEGIPWRLGAKLNVNNQVFGTLFLIESKWGQFSLPVKNYGFFRQWKKWKSLQHCKPIAIWPFALSRPSIPISSFIRTLSVGHKFNDTPVSGVIELKGEDIFRKKQLKGFPPSWAVIWVIISKTQRLNIDPLCFVGVRGVKWWQKDMQLRWADVTQRGQHCPKGRDIGMHTNGSCGQASRGLTLNCAQDCQPSSSHSRIVFSNGLRMVTKELADSSLLKSQALSVNSSWGYTPAEQLSTRMTEISGLFHFCPKLECNFI